MGSGSGSGSGAIGVLDDIVGIGFALRNFSRWICILVEIIHRLFRNTLVL